MTIINEQQQKLTIVVGAFVPSGVIKDYNSVFVFLTAVFNAARLWRDTEVRCRESTWALVAVRLTRPGLVRADGALLARSRLVIRAFRTDVCQCAIDMNILDRRCWWLFQLWHTTCVKRLKKVTICTSELPPLKHKHACVCYKRPDEKDKQHISA